jgi:hypothetical protein
MKRCGKYLRNRKLEHTITFHCHVLKKKGEEQWELKKVNDDDDRKEEEEEKGRLLYSGRKLTCNEGSL